jgi:hypothetical protein
MSRMPAARHLVRCSTAVLASVAILGCSLGVDDNAGAHVGMNCVDDSKHCIDERTSALRSIINDRDRKWVKEPATPAAYASGVRLFAFKHHKRSLSCEELAIGRREADNANSALRGAGSGSLTPAQVSRGAMLGAEVSRELATEMQRRCKV